VRTLYFLGFPKGKCHNNQTFRLTPSLDFEMYVKAAEYAEQIFEYPYHRETTKKIKISFIFFTIYNPSPLDFFLAQIYLVFLI
jgi:hypothetical protein